MQSHSVSVSSRCLLTVTAVGFLTFTALGALGVALAGAQTVPRSNTVPSRDGVPIAYSTAGRGEPAIVFVHGWACDQSYWRDQVAYFARTNQVIAIDLAGHGASGRGRRDWTIEGFGNDVAAVVRASGVRRAVLVGHSLGGPVVVEASLQLPEQTVAVVGVDTFMDGWSAPAFTNLVAGLREDFVGGTTRFVRGTLFNARSDTALARRVATAMSAAPPEIGVPTLASLVPWSKNRSAQAFAALRVPLGAIQASANGHTQLEQARASLRVLDSSVMPGAHGHFLMLEDPGQFNVLLDSLIRRLAR